LVLKVAVVGVGRWGRNHVRVLSRLVAEGEIDELVLVDLNAATVRSVARKYGVEKCYTDVVEMRDKEKPDAAIIAVPTFAHYKVSRLLLDSMDLLIEKPIAATVEEALDIVRRAEKAGRVVAVGHIERFNPAITTLRERMDSLFRLDEIAFISGERVGPGPPSSKSEAYLSVAHDLLVHDIDIVTSLLNRLPRRVTALGIRGYGHPYEVEMNAIYEFPSGISAFLRASWRSSPTFKKRVLTIHAHDRVITVDYILQTLAIERGLVEHRMAVDYYGLIAAYKSRDREERVVFGSEASEPLLLEDSHFIKCVKGRAKPLVSAVEGYIALKNALMAVKASREGRWVDVEWDEDFIDPSMLAD